jgi:uncharacterized membrane protein YoaK (UPF0700 family)
MISKLPRWVWGGAAVLAFSAGLINVIAFLGFAHQAATHVTGLFSHLSIALFHRDSEQIALTFFVILSFFSGAVLSGLLIRDAHLQMGRRYGFALAVECALLLAATYGFQRSSVWGEYFASMAAGLQNALVSTYSGAIVRTTHLTGILTDLGVLIGHGLQGLPFEAKRIKLLFIIITAFLSGGIAGSFLFKHYDYLAMLAPAILIGCSSLGYSFIHRQSRHK